MSMATFSTTKLTFFQIVLILRVFFAQWAGGFLDFGTIGCHSECYRVKQQSTPSLERVRPEKNFFFQNGYVSLCTTHKSKETNLSFLVLLRQFLNFSTCRLDIYHFDSDNLT